MRDAAQRRAASGLAPSRFVQEGLARLAGRAGMTKQGQIAPAKLDAAIAANLKELGYGG